MAPSFSSFMSVWPLAGQRGGGRAGAALPSFVLSLSDAWCVACIDRGGSVAENNGVVKA